MAAPELLTKGIYTLTTESGRIKERFLEALRDLAFLTPNHFPEELQARWNEIWRSLAHLGNMEITLDSMSDNDASQIAERLWDLWSDAEDLP